SFAAAARQCRCSERTARRKWADAGFRRRVDEVRARLVSSAVGRLSGMGIKAADTLHGLMDDPSAAVRLGAARAARECMFRGDERDTLARMLRELREGADGASGDDAGGGPPGPGGSGVEEGAAPGGGEAGPGGPDDGGGGGAGCVAEGLAPLFRETDA